MALTTPFFSITNPDGREVFALVPDHDIGIGPWNWSALAQAFSELITPRVLEVLHKHGFAVRVHGIVMEVPK